MLIKYRILSALLAPALLFSSFSYAAPVPGGKGSFGNIPSASRPTISPARAVQNMSFPYPTNQWFGSAYTSHPYHDYSYKMAPRPLIINFNSVTQDNTQPDGTGYVLGTDEIRQNSADVISNISSGDPYYSSFYLKAAARTESGNIYLNSSMTRVSDSSDWSFTALVEHSSNSSLWMKTTVTKGSVFVFNNYSANLKPYLTPVNGTFEYYDENGVRLNASSSSSDRIIVKTSYIINGTAKTAYFGIYVPEGTILTTNANYLEALFNVSATEQQRYMTVALLAEFSNEEGSKTAVAEILQDYYRFAYNFITDTKAVYTYDKTKSAVTTDFEYTFDRKRTGSRFQDGTIMALFPHQWKNLSSPAIFKTQTFKTQRGMMKLIDGTGFSTKYLFRGIIPYLSYEIPDSLKPVLSGYINTDKNFNPANTSSNDTYRAGKALGKAASLIPVLHQNGNGPERDAMIQRLKNELSTWYTYRNQNEKFFGYDSTWGGVIGVPSSFGSNNYNDHNFHYGYFIYASAILAMFDPSFAQSAEYKGIVDLLVKDICNTDRQDSDFPYIRQFDVYEGHSWANGAGGSSNKGVDLESTSEAMNAWAAVYLWGTVTENQQLIDAGIYGYTTEFESVREYFFDMDEEIYPAYKTAGGYSHNSVGILWDNAVEYYLHWRWPYDSSYAFAQELKGIQILPLNPTMLYMGYNTGYAQKFYEQMLAEPNQNPNYWKDIWARFVSFYNPGAALAMMNGLTSAEEGSSLTYTYHFINFFNAAGAINTGYYADDPMFCVTEKNGVKTYFAYNNSESAKNVSFYAFNGNGRAGTMTVPPKTLASTKDFITVKYDSIGYIAQIIRNNWDAVIAGTASDFDGNPSLHMEISTLPDLSEFYSFAGPVFEVTKDPSVNFINPVPMTINYGALNLPPGTNESALRIAIIDPVTGDFSILPETPDISAHKITSNIQVGGRYILLEVLDSPRKLPVYPYPNPYRPSKHSGGITFTGLKKGAQIKIYNVAGEIVYRKKTDRDGSYSWNVKNDSGSKISSGVYVYYIENDGTAHKGKLAVER